MSVYSDQYGKRGAAVGALLEYIAGLEDSQLNPDRDCYARNRTLASQITVSKRTAQRYLAQLRELGHIEQVGKLAYGHDRELRLTQAGREILAQARLEHDAARERQSNSGRGDIRFRADTGGMTVVAKAVTADRAGVPGDVPSRSSVHSVHDIVQDPRDAEIASLKAEVQQLKTMIEEMSRQSLNRYRGSEKTAGRKSAWRNQSNPSRRHETPSTFRSPGVRTWNELEEQLQATISPGSLGQIRAAFRGETGGTLTFGAGLPAFLQSLIARLLDDRVRFEVDPTGADSVEQEVTWPARTNNHAA